MLKDWWKKIQKKRQEKQRQRKILRHWKAILVVLIIGGVLIVGIFQYFIFRAENSQAALKAGPGRGLIPNIGQFLKINPYGGGIKFTIDGSSASSCLPTQPLFIIPLIIRCILQIPFVLHVFDNYLQPPVDAFDILRDTVLEPIELEYSAVVCEEYFCSTTVVDCEKKVTACIITIFALQQANISPVGLTVAGLREISGVKSPGIVLILFPDEGIRPSCRNSGYILGRGRGLGLYFTLRGHNAGDSCRGSYYLLK